jgi:hypothetical protein
MRYNHIGVGRPAILLTVALGIRVKVLILLPTVDATSIAVVELMLAFFASLLNLPSRVVS